MSEPAARWNKGIDRAIDGMPRTGVGDGFTLAPLADRQLGPERFGQLVHTSSDPGDGRAGWRVKQVSGGITTDEQRALVGRIAHHFIGRWEPSRYVDPAALAARPRRVMYAPLAGLGAAYWHSVPAGSDSSRRPGNVFVHVVLDRRPDTGVPALRSSDLLGSGHWLAPYGAAAVLDADLEQVPSPPWGGVSRDTASVVSFLLDKVDVHPNVLQALLDAVAAAMRPEPHGMVVLGVERPADAHLWIAALCHLMSPGTSRRFYWSTAERPDTVALAAQHGLHLVVVGLEALDRIRGGPDLLVIADRPGEIGLGNLSTGEDHETAAGARVAVTPWSVLASAVLRDGDHAMHAMGMLDRVAGDVGDTDLPCAWPLAMAVLHRPADFADALPAARRLLTDVAPPAGLDGAPHLRRLIRLRLTEGFGPTTEDAYRAVDGLDGPARAQAVNVYLERAMSDREWLTRAWPDRGGAVPVPAFEPAELEPDVVAAVADALADVTDLAAGLRLVDFLDGARLLRPDVIDDGPGHVVAMLERLAGRRLLHAVDGTCLVDSAGPVPERVQAAHVRPWVDVLLEKDPHPAGRRLAPAVLRWLFPQPPPAPPPAAAVPETVAELAAQALLVVADPSLFRAVAVRAAARHGSGHAEIARIAVGRRWSVEELCGALVDADPVSLAPVLPPALLAAAWDDELAMVLNRVRARPADSAAATGSWGDAVSCAELCVHASQWWRHPEAGVPTGGLLDLAESALGRLTDGSTPILLGRDLHDALRTAWVADLVAGAAGAAGPPQPRPVLDGVLDVAGSGRAVPQEVAAQLRELAHRGDLDDVDIAHAALVTSPAWAGAPMGPPWWEPLGALTAGPGGRPLLEWVVHRRVVDGAVGADVVAEVRRRVETGGWRSDPERKAFVTGWWQAVGLDGSGSAGERRWKLLGREGGHSR